MIFIKLFSMIFSLIGLTVIWGILGLIITVMYEPKFDTMSNIKRCVSKTLVFGPSYLIYKYTIYKIKRG